MYLIRVYDWVKICINLENVVECTIKHPLSIAGGCRDTIVFLLKEPVSISY